MLRVPLQNKTMNAVTVGHAGTPQLRQLDMVNIDMFRHPKYYKELRKRNNGHGRANLNGPRVAGARSLPASDQAISKEPATAGNQRSPGPGLRSYPLSGNGGKLDSLQTLADKAKAPSRKPQASSVKLQQVASRKLQASRSKPQAPRSKLQASSPEYQAP